MASTKQLTKPAETSTDEKALADTNRPFRIGLWTLLIGLLGGGVWAAFAPLDEGVPTTGMVAIDTKRKAVQHLQGGIVRDILVKEGSVVREGDVLLRLDNETTRANQVALRQNYMGLRASENRLVAEQTGARAISFHPDLSQAADDPLIRQQINNQAFLFAARRSALQAELAAINESIQGSEGYLLNLKSSLGSRRIQLTLTQEELEGLRPLVNEGYAPKSQMLEKERASADLSASIAELQGNILRTQKGISEMQQKALQRREEYRKEVETALAEIRREVDGAAEKLKAMNSELARVDIRSPASGQVVGLVIQTPGAVIQAAQKLMDIVPEKEMLLLETHIPPHLIDRVRPGMPVDARFSAFAHSPQLVVEGRLESISGDLITPSTEQPPYYLARVTVTETGISQLGNRALYPGMPVEVIIKTGERTVLKYILNPLIKRLAASLKEE